MSRAPGWTRSLGPLVLADLRQRYAGSALGGAWAFLGPLVEVAAYAVVFGFLVRPHTDHDGFGYALFVASGILPWAALREAVEGSASLLPAHRWIRRSPVPVDLLVARHCLVASSRAAIGLLVVLLAAFLSGRGRTGAGLVLAAAALVLQAVAVFGVGLAAAPLGTLYPDLRPALTSALTVLVFASPILYPENMLSPSIQAALEWNPFTHLLRLYRAPLAVSGAAATGLDVAVAAAAAAAAVAAGHALKARLRWTARDRL